MAKRLLSRISPWTRSPNPKPIPVSGLTPRSSGSLTANVKAHGVLQPILVRPLPNGKADHYELVAGARRYRASKAAGRDSIPARVVTLSDAETLELQCVELSGAWMPMSRM